MSSDTSFFEMITDAVDGHTTVFRDNGQAKPWKVYLLNEKYWIFWVSCLWYHCSNKLPVYVC